MAIWNPAAAYEPASALLMADRVGPLLQQDERKGFYI